MHHMPAGPSAATRLTAFLRRRAALLSTGFVCAVVAALVLGALLLTGRATPTDDAASVDSASALTPGADDLEPGAVRMGVDGAPAAGSPTDPTGETAPPPPAGPAPDTAPDTPSATPPGTPAAGDPGTTAPGSTAPGSTPPGTTAPGSTAPDTPTANSAAPDSTPADTPSTAGTPTATVAAPPPPATPAAAPGTADPAEEQVLALVNRERAAAGCGAVVADGGLTAVARAHSADMRDRGFFAHTDPDGRSPFDRAAATGVGGARAENIARGQADADAVMAAWMSSPGHRANILDCSLTRLGVGVAQGAGGPWWTQLFGS